MKYTSTWPRASLYLFLAFGLCSPAKKIYCESTSFGAKAQQSLQDPIVLRNIGLCSAASTALLLGYAYSKTEDRKKISFIQFLKSPRAIQKAFKSIFGTYGNYYFMSLNAVTIAALGGAIILALKQDTPKHQSSSPSSTLRTVQEDKTLNNQQASKPTPQPASQHTSQDESKSINIPQPTPQPASQHTRQDESKSINMPQPTPQPASKHTSQNESKSINIPQPTPQPASQHTSQDESKSINMPQPTPQPASKHTRQDESKSINMPQQTLSLCAQELQQSFNCQLKKTLFNLVTQDNKTKLANDAFATSYKKTLSKTDSPETLTFCSTVDTDKLKQSIAPTPQVLKVFDYTAMDISVLKDASITHDNALVVTANFADPHMFGFCGEALLAQDELQVAEIPALAGLKQKLASAQETEALTNLDAFTHCITGAYRLGQLNMYGDAFGYSSEQEIKEKFSQFTTPQEANIITMVAPAAYSYPYNQSHIDQLILQAVSAFDNATETAVKNGKSFCIVQTGLWGAGAFGNHPVVSLAAQKIAAHLVNATYENNPLKLVFYSPSPSVRCENWQLKPFNEVCTQADQLAQEIITKITLQQTTNKIKSAADQLFAILPAKQLSTIGGNGT